MPRNRDDAVAHTRANNRACAELRRRHPDEFRTLYDRFFAEAKAERAANPGIRYLPGPRRSPGAPKVDVTGLDPARCPCCQALHNNDHSCPDCGTDLGVWHAALAAGQDPLTAAHEHKEATRVLRGKPSSRWKGTAQEAVTEPDRAARLAVLQRMRCTSCGMDGTHRAEPCTFIHRDKRVIRSAHDYELLAERPPSSSGRPSSTSERPSGAA